MAALTDFGMVRAHGKKAKKCDVLLEFRKSWAG
jgi:hypothetical protein